MKKTIRIASPLLALFAALSIAGCAAKAQPTRSPRSSPSTKPATTAAPAAKSSPSAKAPVLRLGESAVEITARDSRPSMHKPRARALIIAEIDQMTKLSDATPATSPAAPPLALRIADDYAELGRASDVKADRAAAHARAATSYEYYLKAFPAAPQRAEVSYALGLEYELLGVREEARREYETVVKLGPPKLVPLAEFGLGELAMRESAFDRSKVNDAIADYQKVMSASSPSDAIFPEALARSAEAYDRAGDREKAQSAKDRVLKDFGTSDAAARMQKTVATR